MNVFLGFRIGRTQLEAEAEGLAEGRALSWLQGSVEELRGPAQPREIARAVSENVGLRAQPCGAPSVHRAGTSPWQPALALRARPAHFRVQCESSEREQTLVETRDVVKWPLPDSCREGCWSTSGYMWVCAQMGMPSP